MRNLLMLSFLISALGGCADVAVDDNPASYDDEAVAYTDDVEMAGTSAALKTAALGASTDYIFEPGFGGTSVGRSIGTSAGSWAGGCGDVKGCNQQCDAIVIDCPQTNTEATCNRRLENCTRRCDAMSQCNVIDL